MEKVQLTPMQQFTIDFLKKQKDKTGTSPAHVGSEWYSHNNNGRYRSGGSRWTFGNTSAAYRTLRKLEEMGMVERVGRWDHYIISEKKKYNEKKNLVKG